MKYVVSLNGKDYEIVVERGAAQVMKVTDTPVHTPVTLPELSQAAPVAPVAAPVVPVAPTPVAAAPAAPTAVGGNPITAPMPGTIIKINVKPGDSVKRGQPLMILEAMKMENEIPAPEDGTVVSVLATQNKSVQSGEVLLTMA